MAVSQRGSKQEILALLSQAELDVVLTTPDRIPAGKIAQPFIFRDLQRR
jgi:hypothetical protein